ncbi:MAG TPA: acetyl-CoA carboxylase carboxyltransferase subunit beta [Treponemataceae bacterium]|nr:acetyl-CoA carboxylase carboxyltransferase subunit beta [Treponemataceae bacterium]
MNEKIEKSAAASSAQTKPPAAQVPATQATSASVSCPSCTAEISPAALDANLKVCPSCGFHFRMEPGERIAYLADPGTFVEFSRSMTSLNPISMEGYEEKLSEAGRKSNLSEAVVTGTCEIEQIPVVLALMSFSFMGGSMGSVVGEKITRAMLKGLKTRRPVIIYTTSGGARMQEGIFSLMQMAKTASASAELDRAGIPLFMVLCDPTTGGVTASFAMLGDIAIAEPGALIGFAGPRVIEGTIKQTLPDGFQRAEFQQDKGFVDLVCPRRDQRSLLVKLLKAHSGGNA